MKNKKNLSYIMAFISIVGMSLNKMPYPIVATVFSAMVIFTLYALNKLRYYFEGKIKENWSWFVMFLSAFIACICFFIDRTAEEFNMLMSVKNIFVFLGTCFIVVAIIMLFIMAAPQIKKMGGIAKASEELQPGSWIIVKILFWGFVAVLIFASGIVIWEHFFE